MVAENRAGSRHRTGGSHAAAPGKRVPKRTRSYGIVRERTASYDIVRDRTSTYENVRKRTKQFSRQVDACQALRALTGHFWAFWREFRRGFCHFGKLGNQLSAYSIPWVPWPRLRGHVRRRNITTPRIPNPKLSACSLSRPLRPLLFGCQTSVNVSKNPGRIAHPLPSPAGYLVFARKTVTWRVSRCGKSFPGRC